MKDECQHRKNEGSETVAIDRIKRLLAFCTLGTLLLFSIDSTAQTRVKEVTVKPLPAPNRPDVRPSMKTPSRDRYRAGNQRKMQDDPGQGREFKTPDGKVLREQRAVKAKSFSGDLRDLPSEPPKKLERPKHQRMIPKPIELIGSKTEQPREELGSEIITNPANPPLTSFAGLDAATWGAGIPLDSNGDVGPNHYIQSINTSLGIFDKATGTRLVAMSMDTFMSQGNFGNVCDTDNYGDPVILYDSFEDRWVVTDFAFTFSGGSIAYPPGTFECIAVSKTGDPVAGGWNFYSMKYDAGLGDYPKLGVWPDGIYMSVNLFDQAGNYAYPVVYAFNKSQMYAGAATAQILSIIAPIDDFTVLPANARLQTGTPPPGTPNYFVGTWKYSNALTVYKFQVDWERTSLSSLSTASLPLIGSSWSLISGSTVTGGTGGNGLDPLSIRAMAQNQYSNIGGVESLWTTHTVANTTNTALASIRFYQTNVTGGAIGGTTVQTGTYNGDSTTNKFSQSLAVDRNGNMAIGYTATSSTLKPSIRYAGRLAGDAPGAITQTEQVLIDGTGVQTGSCGGSTCTRWGDYSAMSLDPDGCTFWHNNSYLAVNGQNVLTRIGSFMMPGCSPLVSTGTVSGVVRKSDTTPIQGATVSIGSRSATTDANGAYSLSGLPPGTYNGISFTKPGFLFASDSTVTVSGGSTTAVNKTLTEAATSGSFIDNDANDFLAGTFSETAVDGATGKVKLVRPESRDQINGNAITSGAGFNQGYWLAQTFTPASTGELTKVELGLFCSVCTGTLSDLTVSIRATSGDSPTGSDIATATIPAFSAGYAAWYTATFSAPAQVTAGTRYAIVLRANTSITAGIYAWLRDSPGVYSDGRGCDAGDSGATFTCGTTDRFFKTYVRTGYPSSASMISSLKDANPAVGGGVNWTTLTWTATTPANTFVKFQLAGSNSKYGPFNFVGPDGTAATFFSSSPVSAPSQVSGLAQFSNLRYLRYKAYLGSIDGLATSEVSNVEVGFSNLAPTAATASISGRVSSSSGGGSPRTLVRLTDTEGNVWTAMTNQFGNYRFEGVMTGKMYFIDAVSREGRFDTLVLNLTEDASDVNLSPSPPKVQPPRRLR